MLIDDRAEQAQREAIADFAWFKSGWRDLNPRPFDPQSNALPSGVTTRDERRTQLSAAEQSDRLSNHHSIATAIQLCAAGSLDRGSARRNDRGVQSMQSLISAHHPTARSPERTGRDSNSRYGYPYTAFPMLLLQPLGHLSREGESSERDARPIPATPLEGILLIDKPEGPTSMRVLERVRRAAGGVRCGHAGTLDPLATGLLVVALGRFTKEIDRLMGGDKRCEPVIDLSAWTATDDREGERVPVAVNEPPTHLQIEAALERFRGSIMQTPPAFSAVTIAGRRTRRTANQTAPDARGCPGL